MKDKELQRKAIDEMQTVVSATRAYGGSVKIFKDEKLSGKKNDLLCKPSFNGAHATKLFKLPSLSGGPERLYSDVVLAEKKLSR